MFGTARRLTLSTGGGVPDLSAYSFLAIRSGAYIRTPLAALKS